MSQGVAATPAKASQAERDSFFDWLIEQGEDAQKAAAAKDDADRNAALAKKQAKDAADWDKQFKLFETQYQYALDNNVPGVREQLNNLLTMLKEK